MNKMTPEQWLKWICDSKSTEALTKNYDQWAEQYEQDVSGVWDSVPDTAATLVAEYIEDKNSLILDIGAGTGLAGQALHARGFSRLHGMDISERMLEKAKSKSVYTSLYCCSIDALQLSNDNKPDAMIATGVFADKHGSADDLIHLGRQLRDNGLIVFTVRESFLSEIQPVLNRQEWHLTSFHTLPIYQDPMHLLACHIQPTH